MRRSQELDCLMIMMHSQINRAISYAISDRVIPGIQNNMGSLSSGQRDAESRMSVNNKDSSDETNGLKTKETKRNSRSAFDLRDTGDLSLYSIRVECMHTCAMFHVSLNIRLCYTLFEEEGWG